MEPLAPCSNTVVTKRLFLFLIAVKQHSKELTSKIKSKYPSPEDFEPAGWQGPTPKLLRLVKKKPACCIGRLGECLRQLEHPSGNVSISCAKGDGGPGALILVNGVMFRTI